MLASLVLMCAYVKYFVNFGILYIDIVPVNSRLCDKCVTLSNFYVKKCWVAG